MTQKNAQIFRCPREENLEPRGNKNSFFGNRLTGDVSQSGLLERMPAC